VTRRILAALVLVALIGAPACGGGGGGDDGYRVEVTGSASVTNAKGAQHTLGDGRHSVAVGDTVRMVRGSAVLDLPGDRAVWLRSSHRHGDDRPREGDTRHRRWRRRRRRR